MKKAGYTIIYEAFRNTGRTVHISPSRGVFVLSSDKKYYHDFGFEDYSPAVPAGVLVPRLHLNRQWASKRIPLDVASKWHVDARKHPPTPRIELTLLPEEFPALSALPALISFLETGGDGDFGRFFSFEVVATSNTNLWSRAADDFAKAVQLGIRPRPKHQPIH